MNRVFDNHGIRFGYPATWELDEADDDDRATITVQSPSGPSFVMVTLDDERPEPSEMVDEAVAAMREEYPAIDVAAVADTLAGHPAVGYDLEFFSVDMVSECALRAFRSAKRTVLVLAQWSSVDSDDDADAEASARALMASLTETDG